MTKTEQRKLLATMKAENAKQIAQAMEEARKASRAVGLHAQHLVICEERDRVVMDLRRKADRECPEALAFLLGEEQVMGELVMTAQANLRDAKAELERWEIIRKSRLQTGCELHLTVIK